MKEKLYKLFGLEMTATLDEVKTAYRKLAKENHPDMFQDEALKKTQEKKMALLNNAYGKILSGFGSSPQSPAEKSGTAVENETDLYKKGVEWMNQLGRTSHLKQVMIEMQRDRLLHKIEIAGTAKECFLKLLKDFPESDWAYDAKERLLMINKIIANLEENITLQKTHTLSHTPKGTPIWKKKE